MRILRRKKIHTENIYNLENFKVLTHSNDYIVDINPLPKDQIVDCFATYSDLYFMNNCSLIGRSVNLLEFVQSDNCMFVSSVFNNVATDFVPFYYKNSNIEQGILLDVPCVSSQKYCDNNSLHYVDHSFGNFVPIFSHMPNQIDTYRQKILSDSYSFRNSVCFKIKPPTLPDLNRIIRIVDEPAESAENEQLLDVSEVTIQPLQRREILLLDPLLLDAVPNHIKQRLTQSEHNKIARVTILYTLAFFALVLVTFFIIYLA